MTVSLLVKKQLYYGQMAVTKISGFKDELTGAIITNAFTLGIFDPDDVVNNWKEIKSEAEIPTQPLIRAQGLWVGSTQFSKAFQKSSYFRPLSY